MADVPMPKVDEFAFILLAGLILIFVMMWVWTTPTEGPPVVDQISFDKFASPGETVTLEFVVRGLMTINSVNISMTGDLAKWTTFNKNDFSVSNMTTVIATIKVPRSTAYGSYNGKVFLTGAGGTDTFSVSLQVQRESERKTLSRLIPDTEFPADFSVSYSKGTESIDSKSDVQIYTGYFSNRAVTLMGLISSDMLGMTTGGNIVIDIQDTNGLGSLIVELGGTEIYNRNVGVGEIVIPIDRASLDRSNMVTIKAGGPGMMFWTNTVYTLKSARFDIDYSGVFTQTFNFTLMGSEVSSFKDLDLSYRVKDRSENIPEMMIKINNQIVFWQRPPLLMMDHQRFSEDMRGNKLFLHEGTNSITFMFEKNAEYSVGEAMLLVEYMS